MVRGRDWERSSVRVKSRVIRFGDERVRSSDRSACEGDRRSPRVYVVERISARSHPERRALEKRSSVGSHAPISAPVQLKHARSLPLSEERCA